MALTTAKGLDATPHIKAAFSAATEAAGLHKNNLVNAHGPNAAVATQELAEGIAHKPETLSAGHQAIAELKSAIAEATPDAPASGGAASQMGSSALGVAAEIGLAAAGLPMVGGIVAGLGLAADGVHMLRSVMGQGTFANDMIGSNDWESLSNDKETGFNYQASNDLTSGTTSTLAVAAAAPAMQAPRVDQMFASYADFADSSAGELAQMERSVREMEHLVDGATQRYLTEYENAGGNTDAMDLDAFKTRALEPSPEFVEEMTRPFKAPAHTPAFA